MESELKYTHSDSVKLGMEREHPLTGELMDAPQQMAYLMGREDELNYALVQQTPAIEMVRKVYRRLIWRILLPMSLALYATGVFLGYLIGRGH